MINGSGTAVYKTIVLPSFTLAAGGYYVIGNNATIPNLNLLQTPATDMIQNGAPDAVGLRDPFNTLIDAVSYEGNTGAPYTNDYVELFNRSCPWPKPMTTFWRRR